MKKNKLLKIILTIIAIITLVGCDKKPKEITIEYVDGTNNHSYTVVKGENLPEYIPAGKEGYVFDGFYIDDEKILLEEFVVDKAVKIQVKYREYTLEEKVDLELNSLTLPNTVTEDLVFVTEGNDGTTFVWESLDPKHISHNGIVNLAGYNTGGATVTLKVTAINDSYEVSKTIDVFIPELEEVMFLDKATYDFIALEGDYHVESGQIDLYQTQYEQIYYVDVEEFIKLINGAIDSITNITTETDEETGKTTETHKYMEVIENGDILTIRYHAKEFIDGVLEDEENYDLELDFLTNTVKTANTDFFDVIGSSTITTYDDGLIYGEYETVEGHEVVINLNDYRIDINTMEDEGKTKYLIPLNLANLLFLSQVYYDVYFNQEVIYGVGTLEINDEQVISQVKTSSFNSKTMSKEIKRFAYDYLALTLDYFYGVDDGIHGYNNEKSYYEILGDFADGFYGSDTDHYQATRDLIFSLDDLHTSILASGYFEYNYNPSLSLDDLGPRSRSYYSSYSVVNSVQKPLPLVRYTSSRKTAVIKLNSFEVDTRESLERLIKRALEEPNLENIVIDISANGGGNLGSVFKVMNLLTDKTLHYQGKNSLDNSAYSQEITSDYAKYTTVNYYILQSEVTFSAANLFASIAKSHEIAPLLGTKSGGGASSIGLVVTPTGDLFYMSSYNVLAMKIGDVYESVEFGIIPDVVFPSIPLLYDLNYLENAIESLKNPTN